MVVVVFWQFCLAAMMLCMRFLSFGRFFRVLWRYLCKLGWCLTLGGGCGRLQCFKRGPCRIGEEAADFEDEEPRSCIGQWVQDIKKSAFRPRWYWFHLAAQVGFIHREIRVTSLVGGWYFWEVMVSNFALAIVLLFTARQVWLFSKVRSIHKDVREPVDQVLDMIFLPLNYGYLAATSVRTLAMQDTKQNEALMMATIESANIWEAWALWSVLKVFKREVDFQSQKSVDWSKSRRAELSADASEPSRAQQLLRQAPGLEPLELQLAEDEGLFDCTNEEESCEFAGSLEGEGSPDLVFVDACNAGLDLDDAQNLEAIQQDMACVCEDNDLAKAEDEDIHCTDNIFDAMAAQDSVPGAELHTAASEEQEASVQAERGYDEGKKHRRKRGRRKRPIPESKSSQSPPELVESTSAVDAANSTKEPEASQIADSTDSLMDMKVIGIPLYVERECEASRNADSVASCAAQSDRTCHPVDAAEMQDTSQVEECFGSSGSGHSLILPSLGTELVEPEDAACHPSTLGMSLTGSSPSIHIGVELESSIQDVQTYVGGLASTFGQSPREQLVEVSLELEAASRLNRMHRLHSEWGLDMPIRRVHSWPCYLNLAEVRDTSHFTLDRKLSEVSRRGEFNTQFNMAVSMLGMIPETGVKLWILSQVCLSGAEILVKGLISPRFPTYCNWLLRSCISCTDWYDAELGPVFDGILYLLMVIAVIFVLIFERAWKAELIGMEAAPKFKGIRFIVAATFLQRAVMIYIFKVPPARAYMFHALLGCLEMLGLVVYHHIWAYPFGAPWMQSWLRSLLMHDKVSMQSAEASSLIREQFQHQESECPWYYYSIFFMMMCYISTHIVCRFLPPRKDLHPLHPIWNLTCDANLNSFIQRNSNPWHVATGSQQWMPLCQSMPLACQVGYEGHASISCTYNRELSVQGHCQIVGCGPPTDLRHATAQFTREQSQLGWTNGMRMVYKCNMGYEGSPVALCGQDGSWTFQGSSCTMIGCGALQSFLDKHVSADWRNIMRTAEEAEHRDEGNSSQLLHSYDGEAVALKCVKGVSGSPLATCLKGNWTLSDPCKAFDTSKKCSCKASWVHCSGLFGNDCKKYFGCTKPGSSPFDWCEVEPGSCPLTVRDFFGQEPNWDYCVTGDFKSSWTPVRVPSHGSGGMVQWLLFMVVFCMSAMGFSRACYNSSKECQLQFIRLLEPSLVQASESCWTFLRRIPSMLRRRWRVSSYISSIIVIAQWKSFLKCITLIALDLSDACFRFQSWCMSACSSASFAIRQSTNSAVSGVQWCATSGASSACQRCHLWAVSSHDLLCCWCLLMKHRATSAWDMHTSSCSSCWSTCCKYLSPPASNGDSLGVPLLSDSPVKATDSWFHAAKLQWNSEPRGWFGGRPPIQHQSIPSSPHAIVRQPESPPIWQSSNGVTPETTISPIAAEASILEAGGGGEGEAPWLATFGQFRRATTPPIGIYGDMPAEHDPLQENPPLPVRLLHIQSPNSRPQAAASSLPVRTPGESELRGAPTAAVSSSSRPDRWNKSHFSSKIEEAGYSIQDLRDAGYSAGELMMAGCSLRDIRQAGYTVQELTLSLEGGGLPLHSSGNGGQSHWNSSNLEAAPHAPQLVPNDGAPISAVEGSRNECYWSWWHQETATHGAGSAGGGSTEQS